MALSDRIKTLLSFGVVFQRENKTPLDVSSVWYSYEDAQKYANETDGGVSGAPYEGQILVVCEGEENNITATPYIVENKQLKEIKSSGVDIVWEQIVTGGTKIATITINGETIDVYAPDGSGVANIGETDDIHVYTSGDTTFLTIKGVFNGEQEIIL